jgi:DNA primase
VAVITRDICPPVMRNGRPWWVCPFHEDRNPSLVVRRSKDSRQYFKCYGCEARGDAAFVMRRYA